MGGGKKDGLELGDYYYFYTKNLLRKTGQDQSRVAFLFGGYETGSDLDWALDEIPDGTQLRIYTTSYQQGRVRLILKSLGREAILVNSERLVQPNSYSDARLVQQALDERFLRHMYQREETITNSLGLLDHNPIIPRSFRLGSRFIEWKAYKSSQE